jgi:hypothetical protein
LALLQQRSGLSIGERKVLTSSKAKQKIMEEGIYDFEDPSKWSEEMQEFTWLCLTKTIAYRPSATELLKVNFGFAVAIVY